MSVDIMASLLVAKSIKFDPHEKKHSICHILNYIECDVFPTVFEFNVFIKLWYFNNKDRVNLLVAIFDDTEKARFFSEEELVNKRENGFNKGTDFNLTFKSVLPKPGNYYIRLYDEGNILYQYPIHVKSIE